MVWGKTRSSHTHTHSLTVRGSVMRAAWPFMPLLILCRGLCLVMGPMRKITSARLYIRHVFLSRRFLHKCQTKCWSCRLVGHAAYFKLYQIWCGNLKNANKKKRKENSCNSQNEKKRILQLLYITLLYNKKNPNPNSELKAQYGRFCSISS